MKRIITVFFLTAVLLAALAGTAAAAGSSDELVNEIFEEQADAAGVSGLEAVIPEGAGEIVGDLKVTDVLDTEGVVERFFKGIASKVRDVLGATLRNAAVLVMAAMLSGLFTAMFPEKSGNYARLAGVLAISAVSVASVNTFVGMGSQVMDDLSTFSKMLLPTLAAAAAAGGAVTSAAAKYAATVLFLDIMMTAMRSVIMPLIYAYTATSVAEAAVGGEALAGASSLLKWLAKTLLMAAVVIFIAYISLTGVITSASDAVTVRAAKVAMSTVLPVVGSVLADAADAVMSGAVMLRNAVGVFGMLIIAATCAVPFIKLGLNYLLFKAAGGLSGAVADKSVTKLIDSFGAAFGLTLAMTGVSAVMLFVSIVSTIKVVS